MVDVSFEAQREARLEAAPFVLAAALADVGLALLSAERGWHLAGGRNWWVWLVLAAPAALLALVLSLGLGRFGLASEHRRRVAVALLGVLMLANVTGIGLVIGSLLRGESMQAGQLLASAAVVLFVNMTVFALAFWELDGGGPVRRMYRGRQWPDFQFPQDENAELARPGWKPHLGDYLYVAMTNSIAFSPTDTMPLSRPAKVLMGVESVTAAATILIVAARAVNVFH